jgi:hypothetical protein
LVHSQNLARVVRQRFGLGPHAFGEIEAAVGSLRAHFKRVLQMLARVGDDAGQALLCQVAAEPAHGVVQVARELAECAEQTLFALAHHHIQRLFERGTVGAVQQLAQFGGQCVVDGERGDEVHAQAPLAAIRSKILVSFSLRVIAVNGLTM